jgi:hypothetical protein
MFFKQSVLKKGKHMTEIKSKYFRSKTETMDKHILAYLDQLEPPIDIELPEKNVQWLYPLKNPETRRCIKSFYSKYYSDTNERILILGINPGRFGSGITGIKLFQLVSFSRKKKTLIIIYKYH